MYQRTMANGTIILGNVTSGASALTKLADDLKPAGWRVSEIRQFNCAGFNFTELVMHQKQAQHRMPQAKRRHPRRRQFLNRAQSAAN
jgi:myo-inositol-1-phosphate synthase